MQPNAAQQHTRGPGLGFISAVMEVNSLAHPRAHADMRMPGRECKALELYLPRALLLARRQRDGLARAQPRKRRAAHAKTQRRPELPAELRLQGGVCARHRTTETNRPFI